MVHSDLQVWLLLRPIDILQGLLLNYFSFLMEDDVLAVIQGPSRYYLKVEQKDKLLWGGDDIKDSSGSDFHSIYT